MVLYGYTTLITSPYHINVLVCTTEAVCVYCVE